MKFKPEFLLHGRFPAMYKGLDAAARDRGCQFYHRVTIKNIVSNAGADTDATGWTNRMCCSEEVPEERR